MIRFIVILLLPLALCNDPCCTSTKFTAYLIELGGYLDPKTNTPTPVDQTATIYYDFDNKMLRTNRDVPELDGTIKRITVINNYNTMKSYNLIGGNCIVVNITAPMTANCIPQNATYLGESRVGKKGKSFSINSWKIAPTSELIVKISMTKDQCVPFSQSTFGTVNNVISEMNYMFTDFRTTVPNDVFKIPIECHGNHEHGPPVGRSMAQDLFFV